MYTRVKKFICKLLVVVIVCVALVPSQNTMAKSINLDKSKPSGVNFKKEWEKTSQVYYSGTNANIGEFCYGFDKTAINEDYTWVRSWVFKHQAKVENKKTSASGSSRKATANARWSKAEIKHNDKSNKYTMVLKGVPSTETASSFTVKSPKDSHNK